MELNNMLGKPIDAEKTLISPHAKFTTISEQREDNRNTSDIVCITQCSEISAL